MRAVISALTLLVVLGAFGPAARADLKSDRAAILSVVDDVLAAYSARDRERFASDFEPDAVIVDDLPPYAWTGPGSARRWFWPSWAGSLAGRFTAKPPSYSEIHADRAYVVVPVDGYTKNDDGTHSNLKFHLAFGFFRHHGVWKIHAMANAFDVFQTAK